MQTEVFYEYFWWDTKVFEHQFFKEMWLVWIETRRYAHAVDSQPRFDRFGPIQFTAKTLTAFRRAAELANFLKYKSALELCQYAVDQADEIKFWYNSIVADIDRRWRYL